MCITKKDIGEVSAVHYGYRMRACPDIAKEGQGARSLNLS